MKVIVVVGGEDDIALHSARVRRTPRYLGRGRERLTSPPLRRSMPIICSRPFAKVPPLWNLFGRSMLMGVTEG